MILHCLKCLKPLTKDLYYVKKSNTHWIYINSNGEITNQIAYQNYNKNFKNGQFTLSKSFSAYNNKWKDDEPAQIVKRTPSKINISELDILTDIIPVFKEGGGCCNWSRGMYLNCSCGQVLGEMYLDCYEPKLISFFENKTKKVYKKHPIFK